MKHLLTIISCFAVLSMSAQTDYPFPWNPDADLDGWVSTEDLLQLLTVFGTQFEPDTWETDSISAAVVLDGNHNYFQCQSYCNDIEGNWRMADLDAFGRHYDLASSVSAYFWVNGNDKLNSSDFAYDTYQLYGPTGDMANVSVSNFSQAKKCMCYIQSSPFVPSQYSEDSNLALWDSIETLQVQLQLLEAEMDSMVLGQYDSDLNELMTSITALESAVELINFGCTDDTACNFDPEAEIDDDSCEGLLGCTDSQSNNFNLNATCDDGSCIPYIGMYSYGGVVFDVDEYPGGGTAYVLNIHEEPLLSTLEYGSVWEQVSSLETNGYTDWNLPNYDNSVSICEEFNLINLISSQNGGYELVGYYVRNVSGCGWNSGGQDYWAHGGINFSNCGPCSCCTVDVKLRAVRTETF